MRRIDRTEEELAHKAAEFLSRESNRSTLITVTRATLSSDRQRADILVSIFPESRESEAIHFLKRARPRFREYLKRSADMGRLPLVDFHIDYGEKNRQCIEELSRQYRLRKNTGKV